MSVRDKFTLEKDAAVRQGCGRSIGEQLDDLSRYGNHGASPVLRNLTLGAHGIANPRAEAANCLIFGCYRPFNTPYLLTDYFRLLERLGADCTWLERENCCAFPVMAQSDESGLSVVLNAADALMRGNVAMAEAKGASTLAYCCTGCAHAARQNFLDDPRLDNHIFVLDLVLNHLEGRTLGHAPERIGYFGGCRTFYKAHFPQAELNWTRYREVLNRITGLEIVDMPGVCCKRKMDKLLETCASQGLNRVICPCNSCWLNLKNAASQGLRVSTMPELLLECLDG